MDVELVHCLVYCKHMLNEILVIVIVIIFIFIFVIKCVLP